MKTISIIIITWNQLDYIKDCLYALQIFINDNQVEVFVVDNGSSDGTLEFIRRTFKNIIIIENKTNKGVSCARNQGLRKATGKYILILDNDTIANNEAIDGMQHFLQEHPAVGLCSCRLKDNEGHIQNSAKSFPGRGVKLRNIINSKGEAFNTSESNELMEPVYVIGACQMFRREIIDQIGLIDEDIFY